MAHICRIFYVKLFLKNIFLQITIYSHLKKKKAKNKLTIIIIFYTDQLLFESKQLQKTFQK
jgi:uncharacterized protein (DUF486 family)